MPSKQITESFQIFTANSMSGTATITSSVSSIKYRDNVALQLKWTGDPVGTFFVQGSLDYNPGGPQFDGGTNAGTWDTFTLSTTPTAGSGSSHYLINMSNVACPWIRLQYTNTSSQGSLTGTIFTKAHS